MSCWMATRWMGRLAKRWIRRREGGNMARGGADALHILRHMTSYIIYTYTIYYI